MTTNQLYKIWKIEMILYYSINWKTLVGLMVWDLTTRNHRQVHIFDTFPKAAIPYSMKLSKITSSFLLSVIISAFFLSPCTTLAQDTTIVTAQTAFNKRNFNPFPYFDTIKNVPRVCGEGHGKLTFYYSTQLKDVDDFIVLQDEFGKSHGRTRYQAQCSDFDSIVVPLSNDVIRKWTADSMVALTLLQYGTSRSCGWTSNHYYYKLEIYQNRDSNDVEVFAIDSPTVFCRDSQSIQFIVNNVGLNHVDSAIINWELAGRLQSPFKLYDLPTCSDTVVNHVKVKLDKSYVADGANLKVWTSQPNGVPDRISTNDTFETILRRALRGVYTVGKSTSDFPTLGNAITELETRGICGPVVIRIEPGAYHERFVLHAVKGANSVNTIRFVGKNRDRTVITHAAKGKYDWQTILMDGCKYTTFDSLTIRSTGSTFQNCIWFTNGADYNEVKNCNLKTDVITDDDNSKIPIVGSASMERIDGYGLVGLNNRIERNYISGGYANIYWYGSGNPAASGFDIVGNTMRHGAFYGAYIRQNGLVSISENVLDSPAYYRHTAIYGDVEVSRNQIVSTYIGIDGSPWIANNLISCIGYTDNQVGIQLRKSNSEVYHNNIKMTNGPAIWRDNGTSHSIINNIIEENYHWSQEYGKSQNDVRRNLLYSRSGNYPAPSWSGYNTNYIGSPGFKSAYDLMVTPRLVNNLAILGLGINEDFNGRLRYSLSDIGAFEFYVDSFDLDIIQVQTKLPLEQGSQNISALFRSNGTDTLFNDTALVYYTINGGAKIFDTLIIDTLPPLADTLFTFSTPWQVAKGKNYEYCVGIDSTTLPDPDSTVLKIDKLCKYNCYGMAGEYTIAKQGGDYSSFKDALDALYNCAEGVLGPVTFLVKQDIYEEQILVKGSLEGTSPTNAVTFRGESRENTVLRFQAAGQRTENIRLDNCQHFVFENFTLENKHYDNASGVSIINDAAYNTIKNCDIYMRDGEPINSSFFNKENVGINGSGHYTKILDCSIQGGYYGIYLDGGTGTELVGNTIEKEYYYGIYLSDIDSYKVSNNAIAKPSYKYRTAALFIDDCSRGNITSNVLSAFWETLIMKNENEKSTTDSTFIINNMISDGGRINSTSSILLEDCDQLIILHNSVIKSGGQGLEMEDCDNPVIKNNSFSLEHTGDIFIFKGGKADTGAIDYNNFHCPDTNRTSTYDFVIDNIGYNSLRAMQQGNTAWNQNSINVNPQYKSRNDLHVYGSSMKDKGDKLLKVLSDFDGDLRFTALDSLPDIGVDESMAGNYDIDFEEIETFYHSRGKKSVKVTLANSGDSAIIKQNISLEYQVNSLTAVHETLIVDTLAAGRSIDYIFSQTFNTHQYISYNLVATIVSGVMGDPDAKDSITTQSCKGLKDTIVVDQKGGSDYESIKAVVEDLKHCGMDSSVVILVNPGQYYASIDIPELPGMKGNRLSIIGTDKEKSILVGKYSPYNKAAIHLDGADNVLIENLTIKGEQIALRANNEADSNTIRGCYIEAKERDRLGWNGASIGFIPDSFLLGSTGPGTVRYPNCGDYNIIENNEIIGGMYGVVISGYWQGGQDSGNVIRNNIFKEQQYAGISITDQVSTTIEGNNLDSFKSESYIGIAGFRSKNSIIRNNRVRMLVTDIKTGLDMNSNNGIGLSAENLNGGKSYVYNNMVSCIGSGRLYQVGLSLSGSDSIYAYHNTVLGNSYQESGIGLMHLYGLTDSEVLNNNVVSISNRLLMSLGQNTRLKLDYNNYYRSDSTMENPYSFKWGDTLYTDFKKWRQGSHSYDINSHSINPKLVSQSNLHAGSQLLVGAAKPVGIIKDFDRETRKTIPDIGADELSKSITLKGLLVRDECRKPGNDTLVLKIEANSHSPLGPGDTLYQYIKVDNKTYLDTHIVNGSSLWGTMELSLKPMVDISQPGQHTVSAWIILSNGQVKVITDTLTKTVNTAPFPQITVQLSDACRGDSTVFTSSSSITMGTIVSKIWSFGDGDSSLLTSPKHVYNSVDTFVVSFNVESDKGCKSTYKGLSVVNPVPLAGFEILGGCQTDTIEPLDTSSIVFGTMHFAWDFGDGGKSKQTKPKYVYTLGGTLNAKLTLTTTQGCVDSAIRVVRINPSPKMAVSVNPVCEGDSSIFTNNSTLQYGSISEYKWRFPKGNTDTVKSPTRYFASKGSYAFTLIAETDSGCVDSISGEAIVNEMPTAVFTARDWCLHDSLKTSNTSTGPITNVEWSFGDGNFSKLEAPSHRYDTSGVYEVKLRVGTKQGCWDSTATQVTITSLPIPSFEVHGSCRNESFQFTNTSVIYCGSIIGQKWYFGDGSTSTTKSPMHKYTISGTMDVVLVVTGTNGKDSITKTINVLDIPKPNFIAPEVCQGFATLFSDSSTAASGSNISSYHWSFGNGDSSNLKQPNYTFGTVGTQLVSLVVLDSNSCRDTITKTVRVNENPQADFSGQNVCDGDSSRFSNTSTISSGQLAHQWFLDGTVASTKKDFTALLAAKKGYETKLIISSDKGCTDTTKAMHDVWPIAEVKMQFDSACSGREVQFKNLSTEPAGTNVLYQWNFGENDSTKAYDTKYAFIQDGSYLVRLIAKTDKGCQSETKDSILIFPTPDLAVTIVDHCLNDTMPLANNTTVVEGYIDYLWNFGDSTTQSKKEPIKVYSKPGEYVIELLAVSSRGCRDSLLKKVEVYDLPNAYFNFTQTSATEINFEPVKGAQGTHMWDFGDETTSSSETSTHVYSKAGTYTVELSVESFEGCVSKTQQEVLVKNLGIRNIDGLDRLAVYPNPFSDDFIMEIDLRESEYVSFDFYDAQGSLIDTRSGKLYKEGINHISISEFQSMGSGLMIVRMTMGDSVGYIRVLKLK